MLFMYGETYGDLDTFRGVGNAARSPNNNSGRLENKRIPSSGCGPETDSNFSLFVLLEEEGVRHPLSSPERRFCFQFLCFRSVCLQFFSE